MATASSNGGGDGRKQDGGGKERCNNQIEVTVAAGCNNSHRRSSAEMVDDICRGRQCVMAFDGDGNGAARRQRDDCKI
jgi:hypothetical protein